MKALLSHAAGGPETLVLDNLPDPVAGPGQVVVAIKACSINFPDALMIRDLYQFRPARPFAPGSEIAGVITALGEGVTGWAVGDRVIGLIGSGGLATHAVVEQGRLFALPDGVDYDTGAALLMTYGTNYHGLVDRGHIKAGDVVLVLGAAGGVGLAAVELAKAFGARVIAAVSSEEKAALVREVGADDVVIYGRGPFDKAQSKELADAFKTACGPNGANIIYDVVGGDYSEPALRAIAWEGRFLVVGFPAGIARLPLNLTLLKSCDVCGVFWGAFTAREPARFKAEVADLFAMLTDGRINPRIYARYSLDRGAEAIASLENRQAVGKVVVEIG
ncbi:NADPH:quinone oxidoreductase family protein [Novosphingobium sp. FSW06-99]|uniref:NADPH:quinone oxidoreductase family protein n=1 Tax=Novosphingobium sp. FSW06-99 TaxID=1739113 RepID=UPI00076C787F|nr:NADPH:quinone oxidoreductase family protein [Novosphingobium sp. FSW06-99]KUR75404.1 NADPH:quinone oxidoreductase [Novosphingobium sp. FSW06-99]